MGRAVGGGGGTQTLNVGYDYDIRQENGVPETIDFKMVL